MKYTTTLLSLAALLLSANIFAHTQSDNNLLTTEVNAKFNQTWYSLYNEIKKSGYKTTYLQKCDFALKQRKYESDKYRILFFGEHDNMQYLSEKYPTIIPFLPLKIVVVENGEKTILTTNPPSILLEVVTGVDKKIIDNWQHAMEEIFTNIKTRYQK